MYGKTMWDYNNGSEGTSVLAGTAGELAAKLDEAGFDGKSGWRQSVVAWFLSDDSFDDMVWKLMDIMASADPFVAMLDYYMGVAGITEGPMMVGNIPADLQIAGDEEDYRRLEGFAPSRNARPVGGACGSYDIKGGKYADRRAKVSGLFRRD